MWMARDRVPMPVDAQGTIGPRRVHICGTKGEKVWKPLPYYDTHSLHYVLPRPHWRTARLRRGGGHTAAKMTKWKEGEKGSRSARGGFPRGGPVSQAHGPPPK